VRRKKPHDSLVYLPQSPPPLSIIVSSSLHHNPPLEGRDRGGKISIRLDVEAVVEQEVELAVKTTDAAVAILELHMLRTNSEGVLNLRYDLRITVHLH